LKERFGEIVFNKTRDYHQDVIDQKETLKKEQEEAAKMREEREARDTERRPPAGKLERNTTLRRARLDENVAPIGGLDRERGDRDDERPPREEVKLERGSGLVQRGSGLTRRRDDGEEDFKMAARGTGRVQKTEKKSSNPFGDAAPAKNDPFGGAEPSKLAPMKIAPIKGGLLRVKQDDEEQKSAPEFKTVKPKKGRGLF